MQLYFRSYQVEKKEKLDTLLTDLVQQESNKVIAVVERLNVSAQHKTLMMQALNFALDKNYGTREIDKYYVTHPFRVFQFLSQYCDKNSPRYGDVLIAALIHNVLEKKVCTFEYLESTYGKWVADAIVILTQDREKLKVRKAKIEYYEAIMKMDIEVLFLKTFDKIDNIFALSLSSDVGAIKTYLDEIEEFVIPMAQKISKDLSGYLGDLLVEARTDLVG